MLKARLDLRHSQNLVMTPQLQQAIKLLQFSNAELSDYIDRELMENPLLEAGERDPDFAEAADESVGNGTTGRDDRIAQLPEAGEARSAAEMARSGLLTGERDSPLDAAPESLYDGEGEIAANGAPTTGAAEFSMASLGGRARGGDDFGGQPPEETVSEQENLRDRLERQLHLDISGPAERLIGAHLIDMMDEAGYLRGSLPDLADQLGTDVNRVEAVLDRVQRFEPAGLFARDLAECLKLQLIERNRFDPAMAALLDNLALLAKREFASLERICGVDREDLNDMIAEIRDLDPKPGQTHDGLAPSPVSPDVLMRPDTQGGWVLELNAETLPRVLVNENYLARVGDTTKETKAYLTAQLTNANWLVRALHQRATTILKVAAEIVRQQDAFFTHGVGYLRPLVLRDIATVIDMHESTVSRVTANKYISTPRGVLELKYFFTTAIASSAGGDAHSSEAVRHRIRALIEAETAKEILSDDKIVALLRREGIDIARRTVAKYREAMRIPSSVQRRREKRALLVD